MVNKESLTVTADNKSNPMSDPSREGPNDRKGENTTANRPRTTWEHKGERKAGDPGRDSQQIMGSDFA